MINFTREEILLSMLYAAIFGAGFAAFISCFNVISSAMTTLPAIIREIFFFDKIFSPPRFSPDELKAKKGIIFTIFSILLFSFGFSVLSYISLDGQIRIYMVVLSFASFYLSKITFCDIFIRLFLVAFKWILSLLCILLRVLIYPFRLLIQRINILNKKTNYFY